MGDPDGGGIGCAHPSRYHIWSSVTQYGDGFEYGTYGGDGRGDGRDGLPPWSSINLVLEELAVLYPVGYGDML